MLKLLLVDDESGKRDRVREFLYESFPGITIVEARSFQSAVEQVLGNDFDLVILDMRITSYDVSAADPGWRPRNLGGEEILEKMTREGITTPALVLTQYTLFVEDRQLAHAQQIESRMRDANPNFRALIHFAHSNERWKAELQTAVQFEVENK